ncbi:MAG: translation initiation factor IF-3 [Candidatus Andersenbacteria bacterium]
MPARRRRYRHRPKPEVKRPPANDEITTLEVRLIGSDGSQLGVVSTVEAREKAAAEESDLVMVAGKANPPVVRIMDLGKHVYEQRKKQAKQKAKSKGKDIKGIRIGFKTDEHDWDVRIKQADEFLQEGHKVKLEIRLRGREKSRADLAERRIQTFVQALPTLARMEDKISRSHSGLSVLLVRANDKS